MIDFKLPSLGADMDEGALVEWLVEPGEEVKRGQIVAEVETDKGIIEIECWDDVVVEELLVEPSDRRLAVGTVIARFADLSEARAEPTAEPVAVVAGAQTENATSGTPAAAVGESTATPPVRHLAHELGVDLATVHASGPSGTVTRDDIRAAVPSPGGGRPRATPRARVVAASAGVDLATVAPSRNDGIIVSADIAVPDAPSPAVREESPVDKAQAMRRAIARSMERSKREIPHYYLSSAMDVSAAMAWVDQVNESRSVTDRILPAALLMKATACALAKYPDVNGHWVDGAFRPSDRVHLGVAVSLRGGGLVAPAIHDADSLDLSEMMEALSDLVARARAGRLRGSEMTDATATVTNLGDRGVDATFPVIVPPQVAIIGFGRIADAPVIVDGELVVQPVVQASLAADHRVTDGHTGGLFLLDIERRLKEPETL